MKIVRNFWVELNVDGRASPVEAGPKGADGGFQLIVHVRDKGLPKQALRVVGRAVDGELHLDVGWTSALHDRVTLNCLGKGCSCLVTYRTEQDEARAALEALEGVEPYGE